MRSEKRLNPQSETRNPQSESGLGFDERAVGITSTIPVEVLLAAGRRPVDLNNVFISREDPEALVLEAEKNGFPANLCSWIKGIYSVVRQTGIREVVGVSEGDCSNTHALLEVLQSEGTKVYTFSFPYGRRAEDLAREIERFARAFGTSIARAEVVRKKLVPVRTLVREVDRLTYEEDRVSGWENHFWTISTSDFQGDPEAFAESLQGFLKEAKARSPLREEIRLGYVGIPPIAGEIYSLSERLGARVVYNEFQRQFSMPYDTTTIVEQYLQYTYPYDIFFRLGDIEREIVRRRIDGLIHYVQSFCFRQISDRILKSRVHIPILTLEFNRPGNVDERTRTRLEAFLEMLME